MKNIFNTLLLSALLCSLASKADPKFYITEFKNDSSEAIELKTNNKTILTIPASRTANPNLLLDTIKSTKKADYFFLNNIKILIANRPYHYSLAIERDNESLSDVITTHFEIYKVPAVGQESQMAETTIEYPISDEQSAPKQRDYEGYNIQLHFVEQPNRNIIPAHDEIDVTGVQ